jgi:hypothetical protein
VKKRLAEHSGGYLLMETSRLTIKSGSIPVELSKGAGSHVSIELS